ncbi:MAG: hypothetical protein WC455_15055 [Dehalococcoidia bacterium]|jgi:hypothetical protein
MTRHILELEAECKTCGASGLYVGMAERDGAAVVCSTCKGTGKQIIKVDYADFEERKLPAKLVARVFEVNPGIVIGEGTTKEGKHFNLSDFGGMPFHDWLYGKPFPEKSEDRNFTCPAWWYQCANYNKKPKWDECGYGIFSECKHFPSKNRCWNRWDEENS